MLIEVKKTLIEATGYFYRMMDMVQDGVSPTISQRDATDENAGVERALESASSRVGGREGSYVIAMRDSDSVVTIGNAARMNTGDTLVESRDGQKEGKEGKKDGVED